MVLGSTPEPVVLGPTTRLVVLGPTPELVDPGGKSLGLQGWGPEGWWEAQPRTLLQTALRGSAHPNPPVLTRVQIMLPIEPTLLLGEILPASTIEAHVSCQSWRWQRVRSLPIGNLIHRHGTGSLMPWLLLSSTWLLLPLALVACVLMLALLALMALPALLSLPLALMALLALRALILLAPLALLLLALMALLLALLALIRPLLTMALMALLLVMLTTILILLPRLLLLSKLMLLPSKLLLLLHRLLLSRLLLLARLLSRLLLSRLLLLARPRKHPYCLKLSLKQGGLRLNVFNDSKGVLVNRVMPRLNLPWCTLVVLPCLPEFQLSCLNLLAKGWDRLLQLSHVLEHSHHKKRDTLKPGPGRVSLPNSLADSPRSRCDVRTLLGSRRGANLLRDAEENIFFVPSHLRESKSL